MMGQEVRERIIEARKRGITVSELSKSYGVSGRSIFKLQALYRATGSIAPRTHTRGRKSTIDTEMLKQIDQTIQKTPDITLEELREKLRLPIQVSRLSQIVREKLGYTYKKRWFTPVSKTGQMCRPNENAGWRRLLR